MSNLNYNIYMIIAKVTFSIIIVEHVKETFLNSDSFDNLSQNDEFMKSLSDKMTLITKNEYHFNERNIEIFWNNLNDNKLLFRLCNLL